MPPTPPVLDYAPRPVWRNPYAAAILFVSMLPVLTLDWGGRWYFGQHPTWVLSIDGSGVFIGPSGSPFHFGAFPTLAVRIGLVAVAPLLVSRHFSRRPRSAAG